MTQFLLRGRCCRDWPLAPLAKIGRCGYCGEIPEVLGEWDDTTRSVALNATNPVVRRDRMTVPPDYNQP